MPDLTGADHSEIAEKEILNGETADRLIVSDTTPDGHATRQFSISLDQGWCERIIASGMYDHDAKGIAHALAAVFGCEVVDLAGDDERSAG